MQFRSSNPTAHQFPVFEIEGFKPPPEVEIDLPDRWVAASLLQKGIRRGDTAAAIAAARYLSRSGVLAVFRRLNVIAWEDVSFGDIGGCFAVATLASSARLRTKLGGDDHCLAWSVARLAGSPKCRITDDLLTVVEHDSSSPELIASLAQKPESELRSLVSASDRCQLRRAVAVWLLMGTDRFPSEEMPVRQGSVDKFFQGFSGCEIPSELTKRGGRLSRSTNTIFPGIVAALWQDWTMAEPSGQREEQLIWTETVGRTPAFVFDGHTARGSRYLSRLAELDSELAWWLCSNLPPSLHKPALKKFCFRTISAQCNQRHSWEPAEKARAQAGSVGFRLSEQTFLEGLSVFRAASAKYPIWEIG